MEVETGFVKAIANLKRGDDGEYYESFNYAIGQKTDPGSTFKLASLMALLEDGRGSITDTVNAKGKYQFYNHVIDDTSPWGYGKITIQHAFEVSSNVFAEIINKAYSKDPQRFINRLKSFGLGNKLNLDIVGEPKPVLKNQGEDGWSGITLPQMAIGYEVEITPIQLLAFYNAVANDGEYVKPQFVTEVIRDGKSIKKFEKIVIKDKICSQSTINSLKICLEGVVERGTGENLESTNFKIAGKTGTAKLANGSEGYSNFIKLLLPVISPLTIQNILVLWSLQDQQNKFTAHKCQEQCLQVLPIKSIHLHCNITQIIMDCRSTKKFSKCKGGSAAKTQAALNALHLDYAYQAANANYVYTQQQESGLVIRPRIVDKTYVPNVLGMPLSDAVYLLENYGLKVVSQGSGKVISQSINPGVILVKGKVIQLVLG